MLYYKVLSVSFYFSSQIPISPKLDSFILAHFAIKFNIGYVLSRTSIEINSIRVNINMALDFHII
jgi:hypothetical protein